MNEFLKGLDLDKETIDTIMAEYGKRLNGLKEENEDLKTQIKDANEKIKSFEDMDIESIKNELQKFKDEEATRKVSEKEKKENEQLLANILDSLDGKEFASEYVQNGVLNDVRAELEKSENKGKGVKEIVSNLTKDKDGIFANPNKPADMPPMGSNTNNSTNGADGFVSIIQEYQR